MKAYVYLAAPWVRRIQARIARRALQDAGYVVTSRWLDVDETKTTQAAEAQNDFDDLVQCDALVVLNLEKSEGKAVEQGIALGRKMPIIAVGEERLNVFQHLPRIKLVPTLDAAIVELDRLFDQP